MKKDLFSIGEVVKVCGISRTTLRRLEERGLLTPAYIDEQSGYRYYDVPDINRIFQIKAFQQMGLEYSDIAAYYGSEGSSAEFIGKLKYHLSVVKRTVEELELWEDGEKHMSCEIIDVPDYVCYAREYTGTGFDDEYRDMRDLCYEAFKKGYRMLAAEPLFVMHKRDDFYADKSNKADLNYICCIPLEPDCASEETVVVKGGKALSMLYYGDYKSIRDDAPMVFVQKMQELGLKPAGYIRGLSLVAPYMGTEIKPDNYVSRIILPVE